ncbi:GNAT family N-acetyltransferase [Cohnella boryungensis]|uniref:GNAT family N-acetyltransferase n=2 Tax=Cohnella boryungensis TaxID=768479 RepID=A0ABV8SBC7_9BACL
MRFILLLKLVLFVFVMTMSFINTKDYSDFTANKILIIVFNITIPIISMLVLLWLINRRKHFPSLIVLFVVLWFSIDQIQFMLSIIIVLMYFLKQTRDYFRGETFADTSKSRAAGEGEASEGEDAVKAALKEPDEAPERPLAKLKKDPEITIREATPEDANTVYALMRMAFEEYRTATPPSSALDETEESIQEALADQSQFAVILFEEDTATAMVRYQYDGDAIYFFRLSVVPHRRRRGYARQLVKWIEKQGVTKGLKISRCKVRQSVQNNLVLYQNMGYEVTDQELIVRPAGTVKALTLEKKLWE